MIDGKEKRSDGERWIAPRPLTHSTDVALRQFVVSWVVPTFKMSIQNSLMLLQYEKKH